MSSLGRRLVNYAIPVAIAATAFLNARTISTLVDATLTPNALMVSMPIANAATAQAAARDRTSADPILDRNPFDHATKLRFVDDPGRPGPDTNDMPACEGVRPVVLVSSTTPESAVAAFDFGGKRIVRRTGGEIGAKRVAWIGHDSVWLESDGTYCRARLFRGTEPPPPPPPPPGQPQGTLEKALAGKIERVSATEFRIDRAALDILVEAQTELMKLRIAPEKEGDRVVGMRVAGVKSGSAVAMLGIENSDRLETIGGVEVSSPQKMLEVYARLSTGSLDRLQIHLTRQGKPMNIDYVVR